MAVLPRSVEKVIEEFEKLPGIGPKSAARMAYHFLRAPRDKSISLAKALVEMKKNTVICKKCFNVSDDDPCDICADPRRNIGKICIVEESLDLVAIEKAGVYDGYYFVLGGVISPADGIEADMLRFSELRERLEELSGNLGSGEKELEVIIATNPSLEGEATASYILDLIDKLDLGVKNKTSRLAMGLPTGADLEYADRLTLKRALEGRTRI